MQLKIDGKEVCVPPGTTVKDAAKKAGIKIPGLCDHPDLKPYGACRLCLVEIDGIRGYPSSCTVPASEGMVVRTDTPAVRTLRSSILEMLLSEHPSNCITCERAGRCDDIREAMRKTPQSLGCRYCPKDKRCELQEAAEIVGLTKVDLPHIGREKKVVRSPFFDRDQNLCILCGRCVRVCEDRGLAVISFAFRGFEAGIGTAFERTLEDSGCRFCGACVDVCPTGALVERSGKFGGVPEEIVVTTCPYCSSNCQIGLEIKNGKLIRARPDESRLCVRGRFGLEFINSLDRLSKPLVRKNDRLVEVSWEEALDVASRGLFKHRGDAFALFTSGALTNEALYMARKLAQAMGGRAVAPDESSDLRPEDIQGQIIIVGDISETNPSTELRLRNRSPIVVSSSPTVTTRYAAQWLRPAQGKEALVLSSLARAMDGSAEAVGSVSSNEITRAKGLLKGASVILGPDAGTDLRKAAGDLARATGGSLCILGRNCNSRGAAALGLSTRYDDAMKSLSSGALRSAYIAGCNPARARPELGKALSELDFLVVQDLFLTETAKLADVVFPAASFAEIDGTFLSPGGTALKLRQAAKPRGMPDWQILAELGSKMGKEGFDFKGPEEVLEEMLSFLKAGQIRSPTGPLEASKDSLLPVEGSKLYQFGSGTRTSRVPDLRYMARKIGGRSGPDSSKKKGERQGGPALIEPGKSALAQASVSGALCATETQAGLCEVEVRRDV